MGVPALLQAIYDAYREKRLADVLSAFDDTEFRFVMHVPDSVVPGGDKPRDKAETAELLRHYMDTYDFLAYDPGPIIVTGDRATAQPQVRYRHKPTGKVLETKFKHLWHFESGKVVRLEESPDIEHIEAFLKAIAEAQD